MEITFEVTLIYGEEYDEGTPSPTESDLEEWICLEANRHGMTDFDVEAKRL